MASIRTSTNVIGLQSAIIEGILLGLLLSVLVGPVFFMLVEISMVRGRKAALSFNAGVWISDVAWVVALYLGASKFLQPWVASPYTSLVAAAIFAVYSLMLLRKGVETRISGQQAKLASIFNGFAVNTLNPSVAMFWIATVSLAVMKYGSRSCILFLVSAIGTVLITDIVKVLLAGRLSRFLTGKRLSQITKATAVLLLLFSVSFFVRFFLAY